LTTQNIKVLITGATGLLGKHLLEVIPNSIGTWFTNSHFSKPLYQMDISNKSQCRYVIDIVKPNVIIHCAGIGSVEYAETHYTEVSNINVDATKNLHKIARDYKAQFVYISSNAVFDGDNPPYSETSKRDPVNCYGKIKKRAEQEVMAGRDWLVIRPFMLYGYPYPQGRKNWYNLVYHKLISQEQVKLVNDVYWQPTSVMDAAKVIWKLIQESETEQVYNIAPDKKPMTLYKFGRKVAKCWGLNKDLLEPVSSDYFESIAKRPINTQYDVSKITEMGIKMMTVKEGLKAMQ